MNDGVVNFPGDTEAWRAVMLDTYSLRCDEFEGSLFFQSSELTGARYSAQAPFLTDSASFDCFSEDRVGSFIEFCESINSEYCLVKSRHCDLSQFSDRFQTDYGFSTFLLDLSGGHEAVWNERITSKTRNQIRKGLKLVFSCEWGGRELLEDFYRVISRAWRDLGSPTHSIEFYRNILDRFGDRAELLVIYCDGIPVSAALCLTLEGIVYHPYAATLRTIRGSSINNVLYWEIIKRACERGLSCFDLGRSHRDQGTYRYKLSWGAKAVPLYYSYWMKDSKRSLPNLDTMFVRMSCSAWKRLPLWIANRLGPHLIRKVL